MNAFLGHVWRQQEGALTFEWILLITVLVIGIVGGVSAVRDAIISELGDVAGAAVNVDQSYTVLATESCGGTEFGFQDELPECTGTGARPEEPKVTQDPITGCGP